MPEPIPASKSSPRLSIEISFEQQNALNELIPWGVKNELFRIIIDDLIEKLQLHGPTLIALVLERKIKTEHISNSIKRAVKNGNDR